MQDYQNNGAAPSSAPTTLATNDFLQRIAKLRSEIGTVSDNVNAISSLHQRALAESDAGQSAQQLERIMAETQNMNRDIRDQLKFLATDAARTEDAGARKTKEKQVQTMSDNFKRELQNYQEAEQAYRQRYRDQIARQYRIVNPDATEDEVRQAAEADWGNEGVFQTAVRLPVLTRRHAEILLTDSKYSSAPTERARPLRCWATCARATTSSSASSRPLLSWPKCSMTLLCSSSNKKSPLIITKPRPTKPPTIWTGATRRWGRASTTPVAPGR